MTAERQGQGQCSVRETIAELRTRRAALGPGRTGERAAAALADVARRWARRIAVGEIPPSGSSFPAPQVRIALEGLLPGLATGSEWLARAKAPPAPNNGGAGAAPPAVVALVLAGNTPLLAWPALAAATLAGCAVFVKMSRDETLWPRLFVESLSESDAALAALLHLDVWPGDDPRTRELVRCADTVIAYGGDAALAALRAATPPNVPFLGYGHALSVGLALTSGGAGAFARDILMFGQGGCLSPHAIFVEGGAAQAFAEGLAAALPEEAETLAVPPVTDAGVASAVRRARDLALFTPGTRVLADPSDLRWTVIAHGTERARCASAPVLEPPVGHGVVQVPPLTDGAEGFGRALGAARGRLSCVGVAGELRPEVRAAILAEGVSRICAAGQMQSPPLDWPNGGRDLLRALLTGG